jgi:hypothetical protein
MSFILHPIDTVENITPEDFKKNYLTRAARWLLKG